MSMQRDLAAALVLLVAAVVLVGATPTAPRRLDTRTLPRSSLVLSGGSLAVVAGPHPDALAAAQYNASQRELGWDFLRVDAMPRSQRPFYHMGFLEGALTATRIAEMPIPGASAKAAQWVNEHIAFMRQQAAAAGPDDRQWRVVGELLDQLQGMADGYNAAKSANATARSFLDIFMINFGDEIGDVETATGHPSPDAFRAHGLGRQRPAFNSHCSALVKVTADDLYVAHDTWDSLQGMENRFMKVYATPYETVEFSAHAAFIASGDDWYQTRRTQLAIQETTNGVMNTSLFAAVVPQTISEFLRVMSATLLASNGEEWTTYFSRWNSGTYSNQYMVVDFKVFAAGSSIAPGTLWIAEQLPGYIWRFDASEHLAREGYWASYNIPYVKENYRVSGYEKLFEEQGNFWSYSKYARPEIFRRNQTGIRTIEDMQRMMRYNDWASDPLSRVQNCTAALGGRCSPANSAMLSIASRGDLMPVYPTDAEMRSHYGVAFAYIAQGCFGAIDAKIAQWSNRHSMTARVIAGPTNDQQPTFSWGTSICPHVPTTLPRVIDFPWIEYVFDASTPLQ